MILIKPAISRFLFFYSAVTIEFYVFHAGQAVGLLSAQQKTRAEPGLNFAQRGTRTLKPCGMRPSNARVYQFRHLRDKSVRRGIFQNNTSCYAYILAKKYSPRKKTLPRFHEGAKTIFLPQPEQLPPEF